MMNTKVPAPQQRKRAIDGPAAVNFAKQWHVLVELAPPAIEMILDCLQHAEVVCLIVYALETRRVALARVLFEHRHMLLLGDEYLRYTSVLHCAAAHGRVAVVQWVLRHRSWRLARAARTNARASAATVANCVRPFDVTAAMSAAAASTATTIHISNQRTRLDACAWVNRNTPYVFPRDVLYEAARRGDLALVAWLDTTTEAYERYCAMEFAAARGHLEVAQWLYTHALPVDSSSTTTKAPLIYMLVPLGATDVMNWITVFPPSSLPRATAPFFREAFATRAGLVGACDQRDNSIDWLDATAVDAAFSTRRFPAIDAAAAAGDLALVQRLSADAQWPCSPLALDSAAANGHLDVVQWLHVHRTEGATPNAIAIAASNGHLVVCQWLAAHRSDGCRSNAMDLAASHGHLAILQWLVGAFPRLQCSQAFAPCIAAGGYLDTLAWLVETKRLQLDVRLLDAAIAGGHEALVHWLIARAPALAAQLDATSVANAARSGSVGLTQWLVCKCTLWSPRALANAALAHNIALVEWLFTAGAPHECVASSDLFTIGARGASGLVIVKWLLQHALSVARFEASRQELRALFVDARARYRPAALSTTTNAASTRRSNKPSAAANVFVWDQHTKEYPHWLRTYARLALTHSTDFARSCGDAGPMLAAQRGDVGLLELFATRLGAARVCTRPTLRALLQYTKAGDAVQWLLAAAPPAAGLRIDASTVAWAARFELTHLLAHWLVGADAIVPLHSHAHAFETIVLTASSSGAIALLQWVDTTLTTSVHAVTATRVRPTLWYDASVSAAANGHTCVLAWLAFECAAVRASGASSLRDDVQWIQAVADAAAENGQISVLLWLEYTLRVGVCVSCTSLERALALKHVDVLQWYLERCNASAQSNNVEVAATDVALMRTIAAFVATESIGFVPLPIKSTFVLPPVA